MSEVIEKGLSRLAYQFKSSIKFQDFLQAFLQQLEELRISDLQLLNERYLDTAVGVQLDGIGEIVGLPRPKESINVIDAFGFLTDDTAKGFTDLFDLNLGGNFVSFGDTIQLIGDSLYRLLLRAKIIENKTAMTVDDTLRLISFIFGDVSVRYFLPINLKPRYDIAKNLTAFEENLLTDLPILIGINSIEYHTYPTGAFSFFEDTDPTGLGFGDITDSNIGGNFAKIIE